MAKILIVGGGVAGLSAGIYAQLNGHQAMIFEKNPVVGGNLTGWQRGDYHIDNCIHWLTGTNPSTTMYKMWCELGVLGDIEVYQGDTLYTCEYEGERISLYKDLNKLEQEMLNISPEDKKETVSFIKAIKLMQYLSGIGGDEHNKSASIFRVLFSSPLLIKYHKLSTLQLSQRFKHPLLQRFIVGFIGDCFASLALITVFAHFCGENGGIPRGSSVAMAQRMANRFTQLGGTIVTSKEVSKIHRKGSNATELEFSDGTTESGDYFILTTDPRITFGKMLDIEMPQDIKSQYSDPRLVRFSSYHCAFACDLEKLPFSADFVFEIPTKYRGKLQTRFLTIREYSHESTFAPKGQTVIQSLTFCSEDSAREFIKLKENPDKYKEKKRELARIIELLITKQFPELKGRLKCIDVWTPATYKRYINSEIGSYMSFVFGPRTLPLHKKTEIKVLNNVFLATQWQQAPGGLPIAAQEGQKAVNTVCKKEKELARQRLKKPVPAQVIN